MAAESIAAVEVTNISGNEVPIETIVNPITTSGIPALCANPLAPLMKKSADVTSNANANPNRNNESGRLSQPASSFHNLNPIIAANSEPVMARVLKWINSGIPITFFSPSIYTRVTHSFLTLMMAMCSIGSFRKTK